MAQFKHEIMSQLIETYNIPYAHAWGVSLLKIEEIHLIAVSSTMKLTVVAPEEVQLILSEFEETNVDRLAAWPTVQKYIDMLS